MEKELYHYSSLTPKVKKSIRKYKKTYDSEFLLKLLKGQDPISPPKFIDPHNIYRFYGDLVTIDNLNFFEENDQKIYQLDLHCSFKMISGIDISDNVRIFLEDKFAQDYRPIQLYIDRLNSLGNKQAHNLADFFTKMGPHLEIDQKSPIIIDQKHSFPSSPIFAKDELRKYQQMQQKCKDFINGSENPYYFYIKKKFHKTEPYVRFGPVITEIGFSKKTSNLFLNKNLEDFSPEDVEKLIKFISVPSEEYFNFFYGMIQHFTTDECEFNSGILTKENIFIPCKEKMKLIKFIGEFYEEMVFVISQSISETSLQNLENIRKKAREEEQHKIDLQKAKLKTKFKNIKHIYSDSWKALCVLYYGNTSEKDSNIEEEEGKKLTSEEISKKFWEKADQSKICKFREISYNPFVTNNFF